MRSRLTGRTCPKSEAIRHSLHVINRSHALSLWDDDTAVGAVSNFTIMTRAFDILSFCADGEQRPQLEFTGESTLSRL